MFLIVGLGNPGSEYHRTRHNVGFMALDEIARLTRIRLCGFRYKGRTGSGGHQGEKLHLLRPRTYMNLSGNSVAAAKSGLKIKPDHIIVVHDDLDLPLGRVRVRTTGGDGGHRGVRSIIERIGTRDFVRVRIGIGRPPDDVDPVDYVLFPFQPDEAADLKAGIDKAAAAVLAIVREGAVAAMNQFNSK